MLASAAPRRKLDLPPPYTLVTLRESGDAFAHACRIAAESGAGTLIQVGRYDLAEFAVVLEPEEELREARRAFFAGMNALADALASDCPPNKAVSFAWPDRILLDGALVGGGRLGWPSGCGEDEVPAWLVFAGVVVTAWVGADEPGFSPRASSLEEEGFAGQDAGVIVESFSRHLMLGFDAWGERGFGSIGDRYLARLTAEHAGDRREIDRNGDLLTGHAGPGGPERCSLRPALETPSWLDPATGGLRL